MWNDLRPGERFALRIGSVTVSFWRTDPHEDSFEESIIFWKAHSKSFRVRAPEELFVRLITFNGIRFHPG